MACAKRKPLTRSNALGKKLGHPEINASLLGRVGRMRISHFCVKSSEEERGKWGRSESESLYPASMINVQEYASEAMVQRGWYLSEFPCTRL